MTGIRNAYDGHSMNALKRGEQVFAAVHWLKQVKRANLVAGCSRPGSPSSAQIGGPAELFDQNSEIVSSSIAARIIRSQTSASPTASIRPLGSRSVRSAASAASV